jgi:WD40 repeat protein/serine/threonine protein kinase
MSHADRNLLLGILAVQMNFVGRDALIAAMHAWVLEKSKPLGRILVEQQALSPSRQSLLEQLVDEHLAAHNGDAGKSLAATGGLDAIRADLKQLTDPLLDVTLDRIPPATSAAQNDPEATCSYFYRSPSAGSRFSILRPHARGGLGQVSVALDAELNREVALKELRPELADDPDSRARFLLEAEITGRLEHPGVVPVYGLGCDAGGHPFYAMRFVKGQSLKEAIAQFHQAEADDAAHHDPRRWNLELRQLLNQFVAVCNVMAYAHSRGVIHRDLKPANILLGPYGETLVVDWGLAKVISRCEAAAHSGVAEATLQPGSDSSETLPGTALGTPAYMSPEQAEGRLDQVGPLSDVYNLGATLYCLLAGQPPVDETDVAEVLFKVRNGAIVPPQQRNQRVPAALDAICRRAMSVNPADRYPTPRALAGEIEHWLADEPVSVYRDPISTRLTRWARRRKSFAAGIGVLLVTAVAALVVSNILIGYQELQTDLQRRDAEAQHSLASKRANDLDRQLYINRVNLAYREWSNANVGPADRLLEDCPPAHRGWEWRFVRRLCHLEKRTDQNAEMIHALAISPVSQTVAAGGGPWLASSDPRGELVLRDTSTGQERFADHGLLGFISGLVFSPDGSRLAAVTAGGLGKAGNRNGQLILWDVRGSEKPFKLDQDMAGFSVALSPDGRWVATGLGSEEAGSGLVKIWDVSSGKPEFITTLKDPDRPGPVYGVAFSPDGQRIAAASPGRVRIWTVLADVWSPGQALRVPSGLVFAVAFRPDGEQLATAHWDSTVRLWDLKTSRELRTLFGHTGFVRCLAYSPDSRHLASGGEDNNIYLWDTETGWPKTTFHGHQSFVTALAFHSDGRLFSGSLDRGVKTWDLVGSRPLVFHEHGGWVYSLEFSPDGTRVLSAGLDKTARIWDANTGRQLQTYTRHQHAVALARFRPDGRHVVSFDDHGTVRIWDSTDRRDLDEFVVGSYTFSWGNDVALRPDGLEIAVRAPAGTIHLWDLTTRKVTHTLPGHTGKVVGLAYSPQGDRLFSTSALGDPSHIDAQPGGELKLWDVTTGRELDTLRRGIGVFRRLAVSSDGRRLALSGGVLEAGEVQVWDAATGRTLLTLGGHTLGVHQVNFSPDGERIATASSDRMVKLWHAATGQELLTFSGHNAGVICLAFSPDGHRLASGSIDWTARIWDGRPLGLEASSSSPARDR